MEFKINHNKKKSEEKPLCKYGSSCYQKNPEHRKKFKHPPEKGTIESFFNKNSAKVVPSASHDDSTKIKTFSPKESSTDIAVSSLEEPPIKVKKSSPSKSAEVFSLNPLLEETVEEILKSMPKDFFDFWEFCATINRSQPERAFSEFGYLLVGRYDLLAKKLHKNQKVDISLHWRYFYDPPEFETVVKKDEDCYHIGYFRDDPSEQPSILASNSATQGSKLTLMGDNIFCAVNTEITKIIKSSRSKLAKCKATKLWEDLYKFAKEKKYNLDVQTSRTKRRQKQVVAKTFNGLGIVVLVKNDIGYRPLPDSDSDLKKILKNIVSASEEKEKIEKEAPLDDIISNVQFANDECDFGMGLELGIDLFCYGDSGLDKYVSFLLPVAYDLLNRQKYGEIVKAHLKNRRKGQHLSTLKL